MPDLPHLIEQAYTAHALAGTDEREPDGFWHPSSVSTRCARKAIYTMRGTSESDQREDRSYRVLHVGHVLHEDIQEAVAKDPRVERIFHEFSVFDPNDGIPNARPTVGAGDSIVFFTDDDVEVQEYKTKSSNMMRSKAQLEELPESDHIIQIKSYIKAIRLYGFEVDGVQYPPIPDLRMGRIAYLGKDTAQVYECLVQYNDADDKMLDDRIRKLEAYRQDPESLPPRLPLVTKHPKGKKAYTELDWLCKVCPFAYRCWEDDGDGIPPRV